MDGLFAELEQAEFKEAFEAFDKVSAVVPLRIITTVLH